MPFAICVSLIIASTGVWSAKSWVKIKNFTPKPIGLPTPISKIDDFLEAEEAPFKAKLRSPDLKKQIIWNDSKKGKTEYSVLYLHGFSASSKEMSPIPEVIAKDLKANLYLPRLSGHGTTQGEDLLNTRPEAWLQDAFEALQIAKAIGEKVIIVANSMGSALALWLSSQDGSIETQILFSPYLKLSNPIGDYINTNGGYQLARAIAGNIKKRTPANKLQELYWTNAYPLKAVGNTTALVQYLNQVIAYSKITVPTLMIYTHQDKTVDPKAIEKTFSTLGPAEHSLIELKGAHQHVVAGDAFQNELNEPVIRSAEEFIKKVIHHAPSAQ